MCDVLVGRSVGGWLLVLSSCVGWWIVPTSHFVAVEPAPREAAPRQTRWHRRAFCWREIGVVVGAGDMSALDKASAAGGGPADGRQKVLEQALLNMTPAKREGLMVVNNEDILKSLDSANSSVMCVGCRSGVKTRLMSGMESDKNLLLARAFNWVPTGAESAITSSSSTSSTYAAPHFRVRSVYRDDCSRLATLITRFPTSSWVAQADGASGGGGGGGDGGADHVQGAHRRRRKKQKGSQRCQHHASKRNGVSPGLQWEQAWERMTPEQRQQVVTVPGAELEKSLEMHLAIHKFCPSCADNVRAVFDLLMGCEPNDEVAAALGIEGTIEDEEAAVAFANPLLSIDTEHCTNGTVGPLPTVRVCVCVCAHVWAALFACLCGVKHTSAL